MFSVSKRPTIQEIHELYRSNKATPTQVTQFFLNRSKQIDKKIQAVLRFTEELALQQSQALDAIMVDYQQSFNAQEWFDKLVTDYPLFGVPYSLKDIILAEEEEFTAASKILRGFKAPFSSTVFEKITQAGAITISITNMDEFAHGSSTENSAFQTSKNPFDITRTSGGSSGGAASSVASGQVVFALGSDTGGSIRQPASFTNVVGLKPTYGLVSRFGVMPMSSSIEQVGPLTNTVEDAVKVTYVLAGKDDKDQTTVDSTALLQSLEKVIAQGQKSRSTKKITKTLKPLKIGIPKEFYGEGIHPNIRKALENLQDRLSDLGHTLIEVSIPAISYAISVYYILQTVEVAANLERQDGIRYAMQEASYEDLYFDHRGKYFGDEAKRRIMLGTYVSSAGYYDAYYNQAQKVRELARREFAKAFEVVDVLLTPTTPEFPFVFGTKTSDPLEMYMSDVFTCGINPVYIPGLTVPLGLLPVDVEDGEKVGDSEEGDNVEISVESGLRLPTGCQLLGPEFSEDMLFKLATEIENLVKNDLLVN